MTCISLAEKAGKLSLSVSSAKEGRVLLRSGGEVGEWSDALKVE